MNRRRSSIADLTGRLLMDDMEDDSAPLAVAPPNSPLDNSAGGKTAGVLCVPFLLTSWKVPPICGTSESLLDHVDQSQRCGTPVEQLRLGANEVAGLVTT